jgi:hypothetical protein
MYIESLNGSTVANESGIYTINYAADSAGQTLNVSYVLTAENEFVINSANAAIHAVSLAVPEPSAFVLLITGFVGLCLLPAYSAGQKKRAGTRA